jgi:hypothetical protein
MQLQLQAQPDADATTHNVIAEVPGGDLANEVVLFGNEENSIDGSRAYGGWYGSVPHQ